MNRDNFGSDRAAATYYDNIDFTGTKVLRTDPAINFNWGGGSPEPTMGADYFSVRWEGQIVPRYTDTYTFYAGSDDGVRLWINGQLIVDNWWDRGHTEGTGTISLVLGQSYDIRMEYYENGGGASASLAWSSARQPKEIVPQSHLFVPSTSGNYWSNALNQYTRAGGQTVEYDAGFNLKSYAGATFTYNAQNQLITGTKGTNTVQFVYDGLGRCLKRTTNGASIIFAYDGWKPLAEWSELASRDIDGKAERPSERARTSQWAGDGSYWRFRIYGAGPDEILWHYDSRVGYIRVHSDVHGSVMALLDWYGAGMEKYTYDAFGKPKITDWNGNERPVSNFGNRFMYTGRDWIPELGIYEYRNRFYHPELGRFLQTDPIGFGAGDMNLFRYCGDDPVNHNDPTGLFAGIVSRGSSLYENWIGADGLSFDAHLQRDLSDAEGGAGNDRGGGRGGGERNRSQSVDDVTINQLRTQLVAEKDQTTAIVPTKRGFEAADPASEVKTPRGGRATGTFGYEGVHESFNLRTDALRLIHTHTREFRGAAMPSKKEDYEAVQQSRGRPMYFTSRYLARHGADPHGNKGNYIILRYTGSRPFDIPRIEHHFDRRLTLPPLP